MNQMPLKVKARSENYFGPIGCLTHQCTRALARLDIMGQTDLPTPIRSSILLVSEFEAH